MKTTIQTLDAISKKYGDCSDYRIAKMMKIGHTRVSNWRTNKNTMDAAARLKAAELLHEDPAAHMMYGELERAKNPGQRVAWLAAIKRINATAAAVVLAVGLWIPSQDVMAGGFYEVTGYTLCALIVLSSLYISYIKTVYRL